MVTPDFIEIANDTSAQLRPTQAKPVVRTLENIIIILILASHKL